jgi:hypothetical protein
MRHLISIFCLTSLTFVLSFSPAKGAQPLTRSDCEKAGEAWDDTANVCAQPDERVEDKQKKEKKKKFKKDQSRLKAD